MIEFLITTAAITLGVALGLAVFQYIVLPIGNGIVQLKELLNERGTAKGRGSRS